MIDADSMLAIDVGTIHTRAMLFDVVDGRYRFVASGSAPTTAGAPFRDVGEGIHLALERLQEVTGRILVGSDARLITPSQGGGGVDACVATVSAGPPLEVVAVGLLEDVSVASAQNLAGTIPSHVADTIFLGDRRRPAARLDTVLRLRPDVIIVAGGTEGGASHSVMSLLESIGLACYLSPPEDRPAVLFAGNHALAGEVKSALESFATLYQAPNVRPTLEDEQLAPAQSSFAQIYRDVRKKRIPGVQELDVWTGGHLMPTVTAFGRMIRFLSKVYPDKGVLGVDVGASATTLAAAFAGDLTLKVYPRLGIGESLAGLLSLCPLDEITRWLPLEVSDPHVRDYLYNKALYPASLPVTTEDLAIEQALARQLMHLAIRRALPAFPKRAARSGAGLLPFFEPIVASGSVLTHAPRRAQSLLMILDGLQPTGVSTVVLDQNDVVAGLGAAALINPTLAVQALEAGSLLNLGTIICLVPPARNIPYGTPCLRVRVTYPSGHASNLEVKYGALEVIPLPSGQSAQLRLQPLHRFDVGLAGGHGHGGGVKAFGGVLGVVIDARGRPLRLPSDPARRRELHKKWLSALGG